MHELGKTRKVKAFLLWLSVLSVSFAVVSVILIIGISAGWGKPGSFVGRREGWRTHMN